MEDGVSSGARNVGRFFLALIPWALGIGALTWLAVFVGVRTYRHEMAQQDRAVTYTAPEGKPKDKIAVEIKPVDCSHVTRADVDGTSLVIYARNDCGIRIRYLAWYWQELSPNGTVLHQDYTNGCPEPSSPGDIAECNMSDRYSGLVGDDRTAKIRVWTQTSP